VTGRALWLTASSLAAAVALAGCGGGDDPNDALSQTAKKLGQIRSGDLSMRMGIDAGGKGRVGFALDGPFALPRSGGMPRARVAYTQIAGTRSATVTLTSTGRQAFVSAGGQTRRLPAAQARRLRIGAGAAGRQLRIGSWVRDPKLADGPKLDGAATQRITAKLDVRAAARDLLGVAGALGPGSSALGQSPGQLEKAVRSSSFELITGKDDRLLRRLRIAIALKLPGAPHASVRFLLGVRRPNQPVRIAAPGA
jgi:hypothetical protein